MIALRIPRDDYAQHVPNGHPSAPIQMRFDFEVKSFRENFDFFSTFEVTNYADYILINVITQRRSSASQRMTKKSIYAFIFNISTVFNAVLRRSG